MKKSFLLVCLLAVTGGFLGAAPVGAAWGPEAKATLSPSAPSMLPAVLAKTVTVDESLLALRGSSGGSRLGNGFKSIQSFNTSRPSGSSGYSGGYSSPGFFGFSFIPFPLFGIGGDFLSMIIVVGVIGAVVYFLFLRRRGGPGAGARDEVGFLVEKCQDNLKILTEEYLKGQKSLEVLEGKVSQSEYSQWNQDYARVDLARLEKDLSDIQARVKTTSEEAIRLRLTDFDEDAVRINDFLVDLNSRADGLLYSNEVR